MTSRGSFDARPADADRLTLLFSIGLFTALFWLSATFSLTILSTAGAAVAGFGDVALSLAGLGAGAIIAGSGFTFAGTFVFSISVIAVLAGLADCSAAETLASFGCDFVAAKLTVDATTAVPSGFSVVLDFVGVFSGAGVAAAGADEVSAGVVAAAFDVDGSAVIATATPVAGESGCAAGSTDVGIA